MVDLTKALSILGLNKGYTSIELSKAYKSKVKLYHPDIVGDDSKTEMFMLVKKAYEFLNSYKEVIPMYRITHKSIFKIIKERVN